MASARDPKAEARAWWTRLGQQQITTADVRAFAAWRDDPCNDAAYTALETGDRRTAGRFVMLRDAGGWSVIDTVTGVPAEVLERPVCGVSEQDAEAVADILNARGRRASLQ